MLHNPVEDALSPLTPEVAGTLVVSGVQISCSGKFDGAEWCDFGRITVSYDTLSLSLSKLVHHLGTELPHGDRTYDTGFMDFTTGSLASAGAAFLQSSLKDGGDLAALHGFACVLCALGAYEDAGKIAAFMADLPDPSDPRPMALAGYCAFKTKNAKVARVYLAKAARLSRRQPEFGSVLKFTQRTLLAQQFGSGTPD